MRLTSRSILFINLLILAFCLLPVRVGGADDPGSIIDMVPYESLAYLYISDLDVVVHSVTESPEWQELLGMEQIAEGVANAGQMLSIVPMLVGITIDEFMSTFGHRMVACFMGMGDQGPIAGLIVDVGDNKEPVEYAVSQLATLPGSIVEEKEYRDTPYTQLGNSVLQAKYGFLDNFLMAGIGGGFEKLVDFYKDGGRSIRDTENFQYMEQKVSLSSNICLYADLERAAPILKQLTGAGTGGDEMTAMMSDLAFSSAKAFALSLGLSGHVNEIQLYLKQTEAHQIGRAHV